MTSHSSLLDPLDRLRALVHGDPSYPALLVRSPAAALPRAGLAAASERPVVPLVYPDLSLPMALDSLMLPPDVPEPLAALRRRWHSLDRPEARAAMLAAASPGLPFQPLLVGPDPIPSCSEDLLSPPAAPLGMDWTLCPGRSEHDYALGLLHGPPPPSVLLPGLQCAFDPPRAVLRHGALLVRAHGTATLDLLGAPHAPRVLGPLVRAAALVRLSSRGLLLAASPDPHPSDPAYALAGVSPSAAHIVRTAPAPRLIAAPGAPPSGLRLLRRALSMLGLHISAEPAPGAPACVVLPPGGHDALLPLLRSVHASRLVWAVVVPTPAAWILVTGRPPAACPFCALLALRRGRWAGLLGTPGPPPPLRHRDLVAVRRLLARRLAPVFSGASLTVLPLDPDGAVEEALVEVQPACPACQPPVAVRRRAGARLLDRTSLLADHARSSDAEDLRRLRALDTSGSPTSLSGPPAVLPYDSDPSGDDLHVHAHTFTRPGFPLTPPFSCDHAFGRGTTFGDSRRVALGELAEMHSRVSYLPLPAEGIATASCVELQASGVDHVPPSDLFAPMGHLPPGAPHASWSGELLPKPLALSARMRTAPLQWITGIDLASAARVLVPLAHVRPRPLSPATAATRATSLASDLALAAGPSLLDALVHALRQAMEYACVGAWWALRRSLPFLPFGGDRSSWAARLVDRCARAGLSVAALDASIWPTSPVAFCLAYRTAALPGCPAGFVLATGARPDLASALEAAATELVQFLPRDGIGPPRHVPWAFLPAPLPGWILGGPPLPSPLPPPVPLAADAARARLLRDLLRSGARRVVAIDITRLDTGVPAVAVVTPGLDCGYSLVRPSGRYTRRRPWMRPGDRALDADPPYEAPPP